MKAKPTVPDNPLSETDCNAAAIRRHYDRVSLFYHWLWGEHIHHGLWVNGESPREAQINLMGEMARAADVPVNGRVLDAGCGIGGSSLWLGQELGCSVLGVTLSPAQQRMAERRARAANLQDRVRFETGDLNQMEFEEGSFDVVWVIECSEHLRDKEAFIRNCARVLRPGGSLAVCAWLAAEPDADVSNPQLIQEICRGMLCPSLGSASEYRQWMVASGFQQITGTDLTPRVERTWEICEAVIHRPLIRLLLQLMDPQTKQFAATFSSMRRAYAEKAMIYGMFTARRGLC